MGICCLKSDTRPFKKLETNPAQKDNAIDVSKGGVGQYKTKGKDGVVQKAKPVDIQQSLMRSVLELFFRSERLRDLISDEDIITNPLSTSKSEVAAVQAMKAFLKVINSQDVDVEVALQALQKHGLKDEPAVQIFNTLQTVFKVIRIENKGSSASIKETLQSLVDMPYSGIEGTEIEPVLFEGLLKDVDAIMNSDSSQVAPDAKLKALKGFLQNSNENSLWPINQKLPNFSRKLDQLLYLPPEDLNRELEAFLQSARGQINKNLKGKLYDSNVIGPIINQFGPLSFSTYSCLPMLSFGMITIDSTLLLGRVKKTSLQIFQEPDIENIKRIELVDFVSANHKLISYDQPFYQSMTIGTLQDQVSKAESNPNLKSDFDPICMYTRGSQVYYLLKRAKLLGNRDNNGNVTIYRLLMVRQKEILEEDSFKIVIAPSGTLDCSKHGMYMVAVKKSGTLQDLQNSFQSMFSGNLDSIGANKFDKLLESMIFDDSAAAKPKSAQESHQIKCSTYVANKKWNTSIKDLINEFGSDNSSSFDPKGENKADLIITINKKKLGVSLESNNKQEGAQLKFITLKPTLCDLFDQFLGEDLKANPKRYTEETIRELMPNYLYVDLKVCCTLLDLTPELNLTFFTRLFEEYGIEFSPKYKAIGFVGVTKEGMHYSIKVDPRSPNKVTALINGEEKKSDIWKLTPNMIHGVYYQRCAKDL
jgi:hypothetical protein